MIQIGRERLARIGWPALPFLIRVPKACAALPYFGLSTVTATLGIARIPTFLIRTMKLVCSASVWLAGNELATATGNFAWGSPAFCSVPPHPATMLATATMATTMTLRPLTGFEHTQAAGGVS